MHFDKMSREQLIGELHKKDQVIKKLQSDLKTLELIFNYTRIGIVIGSADGTTLEHMNPAFAHMHGYTIKELTGKPIEIVFEPNYRSKLPYITEMVDSKGIHTFECMHMRKDGTLFPVLVESIAVYGEDGTVLYRIVNVRDITERKRIDEALRSSETLYRTIFEASSTAMAIIEDKGLLSLVNMEFENVFGYSWNEIENKLYWEKLVSLEDIQRIKENHPIRLIDTDVIPRSYEFTAINKFGNPVNVYATFSLIPGQKKIVASLLDITYRKQSEEALKRATQEKSLILNGISEIVLYYDIDMKILWANRAAVVFTGLNQEQLKGQCCYEIFFNRCNVCTDCLFNNAVVSDQLSDGEIKKIRGRTFFVRGYPVRDPNGMVISFVFIMTDLTERKRIEKALRESENKFKTVYDSANVGITLVGFDGNIMDCNKAFQKMLGYNEDEINGMSCSNITYAEDIELDSKSFEKLVTGKCKYFQIEKRYRRKDGRVIWVRLNASRVKGGSGKINYVIGVIEDITRRKLAEEALRTSEEKFRLLFHNANDAIFLYDTGDDNAPGRFIEVNDVACDRLGYSREELLIMTPSDLNPVEKICFIQNFVSHVINKGFGITETVHVTKTGIKIPVEISAHLFALKNTNVILSIARDLTERKKVEAELNEARVKANRAERLASLGTLAAGVAHEINQPLNSLKIIADSLLYWYSINGTLDLVEVVGELHKISNQADRIGNIINRMRVFVRSEHNVQLDYCNLNDAVEGALNMIRCQLSTHGINVKKYLSDYMPPILADQNKLEEVIINLTINAMQALDTVCNSNKEILLATYFEQNVILEISDNATGVDNGIVHKIFEPFFTTKEVGVGMGLGLSIVHSIVNSFEGQIYVKENHTGGATFRIEFPVAKP